MNRLKILWNLMKGNRRIYFASMFAIIIASLFSFITPLVIRFVIDSIIGGQEINAPAFIMKTIENFGGTSVLAKNLWICSLILVGLAVMEGIFFYLKGKWSAIAAESTAENLRNKLFSHLLHLPYKYFKKAKTGDLVQRCSSDVETIRAFLAVQFVEVGKTIFLIAIAMFFMLRLNVKLAIASLVIFPPIIVFTIIFFNKIQKQFKICDEAEGDMSTVLQENLSGVRVVKAFAREKFEMDKYDQKNKTYCDEIYKLIEMFAWYWSISDFMSIGQVGITIIVGAIMTINGQITLGTLVMFLQFQRIILWPVRQLGRILTEMGKSFVSVDRINEILEAEPEKFMDSEPENLLDGDIVFENVSFEYEKGHKVLDNINLTIKKGETVAILGATGSGKTTLVHLLPRLYDYEHGSIKIAGQELKDVDKKVARSSIGIVLQEPFMYSKTVKENLHLANSKVQECEIFEASRTASIHDVINDFDDSYETSIGEKGVTLSGGQKQRLAIARTLLKDAPILVFDDSLSAVDTETDTKIRSALKDRNKDVTTIIISHRITTLAEADKIIVLDHGKIVQEGTHDILVNEDGIYQNIWNIQSELEDDIKHEIESEYHEYDVLQEESVS